MDMSTAQPAVPAPQLPPPPEAPSLEAVELELALAQRDVDSGRFETAVRETVATVGGVLLFLMRLDEGATSRWVAAVAFGDAAAREIAIVDLPGDGARVSVSRACESALPIAAIAPAYAGLAECWSKAA